MKKSETSLEIAEQMVNALYKTLLLREPDPDGFTNNVNKILLEMDLESALESTLRCQEFSSKQTAFLHNYVKRSEQKLIHGYSQHEEIDLLIRSMVNDAATAKIVVEVGARGRDRSNSYDLMQTFGWRGILIEANPDLLPAIEREFVGCNFSLVHCAASDFEGEAEFFFGVNPDVSSLNRENALAWGEARGSKVVPVRRLSGILAEHNVPNRFDVLSLDIEGEDFKVMNDLVDNSDYRPDRVLIEVHDPYKPGTLEQRPFSALVRENYSLIERIGPNLLLKSKAC